MTGTQPSPPLTANEAGLHAVRKPRNGGCPGARTREALSLYVERWSSAWRWRRRLGGTLGTDLWREGLGELSLGFWWICQRNRGWWKWTEIAILSILGMTWKDRISHWGVHFTFFHLSFILGGRCLLFGHLPDTSCITSKAFGIFQAGIGGGFRQVSAIQKLVHRRNAFQTRSVFSGCGHGLGFASFPCMTIKSFIWKILQKCTWMFGFSNT